MAADHRRRALWAGVVALALLALFAGWSLMADGRKPMRVEVHFQEGFTGQRVTLHAGGETLAEITVQSRFQTGLAHIEPLDLAPGTAVTIRIDPHTLAGTDVDTPRLEETFIVDAEKPFVTLTLLEGQLDIRMTARLPGYL